MFCLVGILIRNISEMENSGKIQHKRLEINLFWKKYEVETVFLKYKKASNFLPLWIVSGHATRLGEWLDSVD